MSNRQGGQNGQNGQNGQSQPTPQRQHSGSSRTGLNTLGMAPRMVRGIMSGTTQPHVPSRRTLYQSAFEASPQERATDIKEILKGEIGRIGEQDVAYRLHRGDTSVSDSNKQPISDNVDPLKRPARTVPRNQPGAIYVPGVQPQESEIPRPVVFQGTPTAKPTKEMIGISDVYVEFDSFEKLQPSIPSEGLLVFSARSANDENPIDNIIEMQIYPFFIPRVAVDETYQPNFYFYRKVTVAMQNIAGIQFVKKLQKTSKWHFELEVQNAGNVYRLEPSVDEGKYVFTKPIRDLNIAEIRFRVPEKHLQFPTDCFDATVVSPADFGPSGDRRMFTSIPHGLQVGSQVTVFLKNFNSTNSRLNTIMNDTNGHVVDVVSSTKLQFTNTPFANLLATAVDVDGNPATGRVCVGERRVRFVIRFRRILPVLTNWISP